VPLSPVSFLVRAARIYGPRLAVVHCGRRYTYAQFLERSRRLASSLARAGVGKGDTVAIMATNTPEMPQNESCRGHHRLVPSAPRAFQVPTFRCVRSVPKKATGKIQKFELREQRGE